MLHRKRGQMSVGHKVAVHAGKLEDFTKQLSMPLRRLGYPYKLAGEPRPALELQASTINSGCSNTR